MSFLFDEYWPWWLGASALASISLAIFLIERRHLGVSGSLSRLVTPEDEGSRAARAALAADGTALQESMLKATLAEFGDDLSPEEISELKRDMAAAPAAPAPRGAVELPRSVHVVFLLMILVGGAIGTVLAGNWEVSATLGPAHEHFFGDSWSSYLILLIGGLCVGLGTRMAGGCTSGHGLTGCGRMQLSSMLATGVFFGCGVAVSLLLDWGLF